MNNKEVVENTESKHKHIKAKERSEQDLKSLIAVYKNAYGDGWVGESHYINKTLNNVSAHHIIEVDNKPAAAIDMNRDRIISIAVHPDFQGKNLGVELFREAAKANPNAWISISIEAPGMLSTVLNEELNYELNEDKEEIEKLYRAIKGVDEDYKVNITVIKSVEVSNVFRKKGIEKEKFIGTHRPGSIHDESYQQLVFQNNRNS